ncbi:MAG: hypothetical protein ACOCT9_03130 [archaeon]
MIDIVENYNKRNYDYGKDNPEIVAKLYLMTVGNITEKDYLSDEDQDIAEDWMLYLLNSADVSTTAVAKEYVEHDGVYYTGLLRQNSCGLAYFNFRKIAKCIFEQPSFCYFHQTTTNYEELNHAIDKYASKNFDKIPFERIVEYLMIVQIEIKDREMETSRYLLSTTKRAIKKINNKKTLSKISEKISLPQDRIKKSLNSLLEEIE